MASSLSTSGCISRRWFLERSTLGVGALAGGFARLAQAEGGPGTPRRALDTTLGVKFVVAGIVHQDAWEGSCRVGDLPSLTFDAEMAWQKTSLGGLKNDLASRTLPAGVRALEPVGVHLWVEKGNPDIMFDEGQLKALEADDPRTDVYVVVNAGLPQPTCLRIAQRFKKPVILALAAGWGLDAPAGIRNLGLEGHYAADWPELSRLLRILVARKAFRETRILRVTNFPGRLPSGVASAVPDLDLLTKRYGIQHETLDYERFFGDMDVFVNRPANREAARALASQLVGAAASSTMSLDEVSNSMLFHLYVDDTMSRLRANAFTIECFELCSSLNPWKRHFTPCASHALRKDAGMPSACEGDVNALLAMAAQMYLSRKSVYMGNPDIDVQASTVKLHHSDAGRRPRGIDGADSRFEIDAFAKAGFGATLRYDFAADKGETVTLGRFAPCGTKMLVTSGPIVSGGGLDGIGCAQNVEVRVPDGRDLLRQMANFGHHLALVYGDYVADLRDLGDMLGFEVVRV